MNPLILLLVLQIKSYLCDVRPLSSEESIQVLSNSIVGSPSSHGTPSTSIDLQQQMMAQQPYYSQSQPQIINIGSQTPYTTPCAIISTTSNCVLTVPDDGLHNDIQSRGFILANAIIRNQCSLTVKDCADSYTTSSHYLIPPTFGCTYAASVCCECYRCNRLHFHLYENPCGILFENVDCSYCNGFRLEVAQGDDVPRMDPLVSKKISSMFVVPGCKMTIFTEPDFRGYAAEATGPIDSLPPGWNDAISSYRCTCSQDGTSPDPPSSTPAISPISSSTPTPIPSPALSTTTESLTTTTTEQIVPPSTSTEPPHIETTTQKLETTQAPTEPSEIEPTTDFYQIY